MEIEKPKTNEDFTQICCWEGTVIGEDEVEKFTAFMKDEVGVRVKYLEEYETLAGDGGEGGRNDALFSVHKDDIMKFALPSKMMGIRWWEDVRDNLERRDALGIIPEAILEKYPKTW